MRALFCALFFVFAALAAAWTKEDHEIFDLVSALEAAEGKGTTFYSWLNVSSSATREELSKAYRKLSMQLHPDKNPNIKNAHERFARLGVIGKILREKESRARYDFFYKNGVPTWRGTGYYYSRFRPGLGTVFVFLIILSSILQYVFQRMNYTRDIKRIEFISSQAKRIAWGERLTPSDKRRRVKVPLGPPRMDEDGNAVMGRALDMVVEPNGDVFIVEDGGHLTQLDDSHATPPSISKTWALSLARQAFSAARERIQGARSAPATQEKEEVERPETPGSTGVEDTPEQSDASDAPKAVKASGRKKRAARKRA
ncbi:DnaJ-domain-containing protein [Peniophora sp. CONT]|nr:DnaJ-domain-containing protein [Peniophora sp. CONT]